MPRSLISKLVLLILHHPTMRIMWSRELHATASLFAMLKQSQDQPILAQLVRACPCCLPAPSHAFLARFRAVFMLPWLCGHVACRPRCRQRIATMTRTTTNSAAPWCVPCLRAGSRPRDSSCACLSCVCTQTPMDMLLKLPGVNAHNTRQLLERFESLLDICQASVEELTEVRFWLSVDLPVLRAHSPCVVHMLCRRWVRRCTRAACTSSCTATTRRCSAER